MQNYIETASVTYAAAANAVDAGITAGVAAGVRAVVTVVDPSMTPVAFGKADNATPHSIETSRRKANTAASTGRATGWMQGDFGVLLPLGTNGMLTNIKGGAPLVFDGVHVGGLGVAGGTPDQDAAIARAVLGAIGADSLPGDN